MSTSGSAPARRTGECAGQRAGAPGKAGWRRFFGRVRRRAHEQNEGGRKASPAAGGLSSCRRGVASNNRPLFRGSRDADAVSSFAWLPSGTGPIAAEQRKSDTAAKTSVAAAAFFARNQAGPKERRAELWWGRPPRRENDTPAASLRTGSGTGIPQAGVGAGCPVLSCHACPCVNPAPSGSGKTLGAGASAGDGNRGVTATAARQPSRRR